MRGLEKRQLLAARREKVARVAVEVAKRRHSDALDVQFTQVDYLREFILSADQRRRDRNRVLLTAAATVAQLALVHSQFAMSSDEVRGEEEKLQGLIDETGDLEAALEAETAVLRFHILKQRKLEALQKKIAKLQRRKSLQRSNGA